MDLDRQIQLLIDNAPPDGATPQIVEAIAPALKLIAQQLRHLHYYILQAPDESWVMTTLTNSRRPGLEKRVIYAFPTLKDASASASIPQATLKAVPVPVTHILFQMLAIAPLDSAIFFETPGNLEAGTEVGRDQVESAISPYLQEYQSSHKSGRSNLPPDIA